MKAYERLMKKLDKACKKVQKASDRVFDAREKPRGFGNSKNQEEYEYRVAMLQEAEEERSGIEAELRELGYAFE